MADNVINYGSNCHELIQNYYYNKHRLLNAKAVENYMNDEIFEEVEHWLIFIKIWEDENECAVPEEILLVLEESFKKSIRDYKKQNNLKGLNKLHKQSFH